MQDISQHDSGQFAASRADGSQGWDRRPSEIPALVGTKEPQAPTVGRCAVRLRDQQKPGQHTAWTPATTPLKPLWQSARQTNQGIQKVAGKLDVTHEARRPHLESMSRYFMSAT